MKVKRPTQMKSLFYRSLVGVLFILCTLNRNYRNMCGKAHQLMALSAGRELTHGTKSNCCGALCKVPMQFFFKVPHTREKQTCPFMKEIQRLQVCDSYLVQFLKVIIVL